MKRALFLLPLLGLAVIGGVAVWALVAPRNLQAPPSALIDKAAPQIDAVVLPGWEALATAPSRGDVRLVNFFASYCVPCIHEHGQLLALSKDLDTHISGITFNDAPDAAAGFLTRLGNPFDAVYHDADASQAIGWGVNAIPTTFVVSPGGRILYRHDGAINAPQLEDVRAEIERARAQ